MTWKRILFLWVVLVSMPFLMILAIQDHGVLAIKKEETIEDVLPYLLAVNIENEFELENIKAMAVIWRSNLYSLMAEDKMSVSDLKRKYLGIQKENYIKNKMLYETAFEACKETKGLVLTYKGNVCYCPFFYSCSGMTRDAFAFFQDERYSYLISVPSYRDEECKNYFTYFYFTVNDLMTKIWKKDDTKKKNVKEKDFIIEVLEEDASGYVKFVKAGDQIIGGEDFRYCLGLSSSCFMIEQQKDTVRIVCKGKGHGFGYSEYGGDLMARDGKSYVELLKHYFPELCIEKSV